MSGSPKYGKSLGQRARQQNNAKENLTCLCGYIQESIHGVAGNHGCGI